MTDRLPEPMDPIDSTAALFITYLDYFRGKLRDKFEALSAQDQRSSRVASGWTPAELVRHLTYVELRWLEWGFEGVQVPAPFGDRVEGRFRVPPDVTAEQLVAELDARGRLTTEIIRRHELSEVGQPGERWDGAPPATLERVLIHLVQEYARHVGHLDIVVELAGGPVGE